MKKTTLISGLMTLLLLAGCGSSVKNSDLSAKGPSSGDNSSALGALSNEKEDVNLLLKEEPWSSIEMDLKHYLRGSKGRKESYKIFMKFEGNSLHVEADCYDITARYKLKDDALSFSKISSPKPVTSATCSGDRDADDAVLAFFSSDYSILESGQNEIIFEATDLDTSVTLKR